MVLLKILVVSSGFGMAKPMIDCFLIVVNKFLRYLYSSLICSLSTIILTIFSLFVCPARPYSVALNSSSFRLISAAIFSSFLYSFLAIFFCTMT